VFGLPRRRRRRARDRTGGAVRRGLVAAAALGPPGWASRAAAPRRPGV